MLKNTGIRRRAALTTLSALCLAVFVSSPLLVSCDGAAQRPTTVQAGDQARDIGYSVLRELLRDERYIKALRLAKSVVTLSAISDATKTLIDDIAEISSVKLDELERLAALEPTIAFGEFCPAMLDQTMLKALRATTAKDLVLASKDDFEINLVVSQIQASRMISHLLKELSEVDPNSERQAWLERLAADYEDFYKRAVARLSLASE